MQHGEREREMMVEVARLRKLHEDAEDARCVLLAELRAANTRADREKWRADQTAAFLEEERHAVKTLRAQAEKAESALAAARREIAELRDDLGASHSRGAHLHCSKDSCDVAADAMEALGAPAAASGEEGTR